MKKNNFATVIFAGCTFFLISCQNFLNGADIKTKIDTTTSYAKLSSVNVLSNCDTLFGSFTSETKQTRKVSESFQVEFKTAPSVTFLGWQAFSMNKDGSLNALPESDVSFSDQGTVASDSLYRAKVKILKAVSDVYIKPVAVHTNPASTQTSYSHTPLILTFSINIENSTALTDMSVIFSGEDITDKYFDPPALSKTEASVTLNPQGNCLKEFIESQNLSFADFKISFSTATSIQSGSRSYSLSEFTATVRYSPNTESAPPVERELFLTRKAVTSPEDVAAIENDDRFIQGSIPNNNDKLLNNRTGKNLYIYGNYDDYDSGIRGVKITEKNIEKTDSYSHLFLPSSQGTSFICDGLYNTQFIIECPLKSEDGLINLTVDIIDLAGNINTQKYTIIKCTSINFNSYTSIDNGYANGTDFQNLYETAGQTFNEEDYLKKIRSFQIHDNYIENYVYNINLFGEKRVDYITKHFKLTLSYTDSTNKNVEEKLEYDSDFYVWQFTLNTDTVSGQSFTLTAEDDMGNKEVLDFTIPDKSQLKYYFKTETDTESGEKYNFVCFVEDSTKWKLGKKILLYKDKDAANSPVYAEYHHDNSPEIFLDDSNITKEYSLIPGLVDLNQNVFYVEYDNDFFTLDSNQNSVKPDGVRIKGYSIEKSTEKIFTNVPALKITVTLANGERERFDSVLIPYLFNFQGNINFKEEESSAEFLIPTRDLYETDFMFQIYGIKDKAQSETSDYTIPQLSASDTQYDNIPIDFDNDDIKRENWEYYTVTIRDFQTGPESAVITIPGSSKTFIADESTGFTVKIPVRNPEPAVYIDDTKYITYTFDTSFDYVLKDRAGNITSGTKSTQALISPLKEIRYCPAVEKITETSGGWSITSEPWKLPSWEYNISDLMYTPDTFTVFIFNNDSGWNYYSSETISSDAENNMTDKSVVPYVYRTTLKSSTIPQNSFVRIEATSTLYPNKMSRASYAHTGTKASSGKYDYIQMLSKNTVLVASDAPALVYTAATSKSYEECRDWTCYDWEFFNDRAGFKQMDFSSSPVPQKYTINLDEIDGGQCYCVIAHFANGTSALSEVMEK